MASHSDLLTEPQKRKEINDHIDVNRNKAFVNSEPSQWCNVTNGYAANGNQHSGLNDMVGDTTKLISEHGLSSHGYEPHPFVYKLYPTKWDKLVWLLMGVTLFPIKTFFTLFFVFLAWIPATIAVTNWPIDSPVPFSGWRVVLKDVSVFFVRCAWFSAGITKQVVKGKQVSSEAAPVIVMGPHSSFVDTLGGAICGFPGVVSVIENARLPFIGTLFRVNQSIFVERNDPDSRKKTAEQIRRRAAEGGWPQLVIFPEGMCCNRTCLLPYRPGAFLPGVSVQPVTIKYPNRLDTVSWINTGPGLLAMFTLLLATPKTTIEVEFHPVYHPTEEEKNDPELYMKNVRNYMSRSLNIPQTKYTYSTLKQLIKSTKPNRGVLALWKTIITKGFVEMPPADKLY